MHYVQNRRLSVLIHYGPRLGRGTSLCSAFVSESAKNSQTTAWIYLSWAQGYLSAINLQRSRRGEAAVDMLPSDFDLHKQVAFLQTYCRSLPDRYFDQAATEMYFELLAHPYLYKLITF